MSTRPREIARVVRSSHGIRRPSNGTVLRNRITNALWLMSALLLGGCANQEPRNEMAGQEAAGTNPTVERIPFGTMPDGRPVALFTLTNASGMTVRFAEYGGTITSIEVPDLEGVPGNVILGFDSLEGYLGTAFVSSLIGRYGNRIAGGRFTIDGQEYQLPLNNGPNHLHGGPNGFHRQVWEVEPFSNADAAGAVLSYTSPDGDEGFPGTLEARVTYTLTNDNELVLDYHATTDRPTPVNLTHHAYFNLAADPDQDILGHELTLNASHFTPVDSTQIPTGEIVSVAGTPFDFRQPTLIGARIDDDDPQLQPDAGYDLNWVLDREGDVAGDAPSLAARVHDPVSRRVLEVLTTQPGIQVYTGFRDRHAIALETQHFPDSPNHPSFPSTIVRPGAPYRSATVFRFSVQP